jgi:hypothetical protein
MAYWFLSNQPAGFSQEALFGYFLGVAVLVRVFVAVNEIPSASLAPELTDRPRAGNESRSGSSSRWVCCWGGWVSGTGSSTSLERPERTPAWGTG